RLVGALGLLVAHHLAAATLDVAVLGGADGDPALGIAADGLVAPDGHIATAVADHPPSCRTTWRVGDEDVVDGTVHLAVGGVDAPRPGLVDHRLEAEDHFVLVDRVDIPGHALAQVTGTGVHIGVGRPDLVAEDRLHIGAAGDRIDLLGPAIEGKVAVFVGEAAGEVDVDVVGHRQVVAADVAEQLGAAVTHHVPGEAGARRDQ